MKQIYWLAALFAGVTLTTLTHAQTKLWPQITPGIYNHANVLAMKCELAEDGLTVTDIAWDTYKVAGCGKRWTLNMGAPMNVPLKNYKFSPEVSGLPVNLTVTESVISDINEPSCWARKVPCQTAEPL